jgi:predicted ABC-type ATPase
MVPVKLPRVILYCLNGHHIPDDVVERRYYRGINNLFQLYIPICENWIVVNNMQQTAEIVAQKINLLPEMIINTDIWETINKQNHDHQ